MNDISISSMKQDEN